MSSFQTTTGDGSALTGAEIKTAYESQPDTNEFSDLEQQNLDASVSWNTLALGIIPTPTFSETDDDLKVQVQAAQDRLGANRCLHFALPEGWTEAHYYISGPNYIFSRSLISADKGVVIHSPFTNDTDPYKPRTVGLVTFSEEAPGNVNEYKTERDRNEYTPLDAVAGVLALAVDKAKDDYRKAYLTRDCRPIRFADLGAVASTVDGTGMSIINDAVSWADPDAVGADWQGIEFACCEGSEVEILLGNLTGLSGKVAFGVKAVGTGGSVTVCDTFVLELAGGALKFYNGNTLADTIPLDHVGSQLIQPNGQVRVSVRINEALNSFSAFVNDERVNIPQKLSRIAHSIVFLADQNARPTVSFARAQFVQRSLPAAPRPLKITAIGDSQTRGARTSNEWPALLAATASHLGLGRIEIVNEAISGHRMRSFVAAAADYDFTGQDYVVTAAGVNDCGLSGPSEIGQFQSDIKTWGDKIVAEGAIPVFVVQPMFGYAALNGGPDTTNARYFAQYQNVLKDKCLVEGWIFVDAGQFFGTNYPRAGAFADAGVTPAWYHDNIHPNSAGQIAYMGAVASALIRAEMKPVAGAFCARLPLLNGFTSALENLYGEPRVTKRGGTMSIMGAVAGGGPDTVIADITPEWALCPTQRLYPCSAGGIFEGSAGFKTFTMQLLSNGNISTRSDYPAGVAQAAINHTWEL